jgi:RNA recognition motif-containing protein
MKLFVGNLPFSASEADIRELFSEFGAIVDLHIPLDRDSGRPRGFAFVTLSSREFGEAAIGKLEGQDFGGRPLRVSEALERNDRGGPPRGGGGGGGGGDRGGYKSGGGSRKGGRDRDWN